MPSILAYSASAPSNGEDAGGVLPGGQILPVALTVGNSPLVVADLGLFMPSGFPKILVEMKAVISFISTGAPSTIEIEIYRDQIPIYAQEVGLTPDAGSYAHTLLAVDFNVPAGFHAYRLETSIISMLGGAAVSVVGPIEFSGLAIGLP